MGTTILELLENQKPKTHYKALVATGGLYGDCLAFFFEDDIKAVYIDFEEIETLRRTRWCELKITLKECEINAKNVRFEGQPKAIHIGLAKDKCNTLMKLLQSKLFELKQLEEV